MTMEALYRKFLENNPDTYYTYEQWLKLITYRKDIIPVISDNFQIGPEGAYEHEDNEITWDDILDEIQINLHAEIPIRVKNWLKNTFESPKYKK